MVFFKWFGRAKVLPSCDLEAAASCVKQGNELLADGRLAEAAARYQDAIAVAPLNPDAHVNLGFALKELGQADEARQYLERAIQIKPQLEDAHYLLGLVAESQGDADTAIRHLETVVKLKPEFGIAWLDLYLVYFHAGRIEDAWRAAEQGLAVDPKSAILHYYLGNIHLKEKAYQQAVESYGMAISLMPDNAEAYNNRGVALKELGHLEDALASYERAINIKPDYAEAHTNQGVVLQELSRLDDALARHEQAIALKPDYADAYRNRGVVLEILGRLDDALASYERAITLKPDNADLHSNRGYTLRSLGRRDEAIASYERAIAIKPDHADAHLNSSLLHLLVGDFEKGWQEYEWRWKCAGFPERQRTYVQPLWLGVEDICGKTLFVYAEQGLGDTLQFCRYVQYLAAAGTAVVLEVQPALLSLLRGLEGAVTLITKADTPPPFDFHCPLMSLPLACKTGLQDISGVPYLQVPESRLKIWRPKVKGENRLRIGLVWSGNPQHKRDHNRSIPLTDFQKLLTDDADYFCLQKEIRPQDRGVLTQISTVRSFEAELEDFSDAAALTSLMDLVITVDTSIAHLAGALGKKVWVLLPYDPDWRWLLDRSDSPWYNSATLFRQQRPGDWTNVLSDVQQKLQKERLAPPSEQYAPDVNDAN